MKKYIKIFAIIAMLAGIMFIFSGCAYYNSSFNFEFNGEYMADKYVDLLIPLDETDERYTDFNCIVEKSGKWHSSSIEIPENSEIVNYNKDGYRSMLMHMEDSNLSIWVQDSEGFPDYNKEYNGIPYTVSQRIGLPNEWLCKYDDPYGEEAFLEFCNKYKKCRAAIFDKEGNIMLISKKIPLVSLGNFYIDDITSYDVVKNKIKPHYIASQEMLVFAAAIWLLEQVCVIGCIITLIVDKVNQNKSITSYRGYIIASSIFNVPTVLSIIITIYAVIARMLTFGEIIKICFSFSALFELVEAIVTVSVLVHFIKYEKLLRKRISKQNEAENS